MNRVSLFVLAASCCAAVACTAQTAFYGLPGLHNGTPALPTDLSGDGSVAVGRAQLAPGQGNRALRWRPPNFVENLTPTWPPGGASNTEATGISGDGSTIIGYRQNGGAGRGFTLTDSGLVELTTPSGTSWPMAVNRDGRVIMGTGGDSEGVVRWVDGVPTALGRFNGVGTTPHAVTEDGSSWVGAAFMPNGTRRALQWTAASGIVDIGMPQSFVTNVAQDISADGNTIVGWASTSFSQFPRSGWTWDAVAGFTILSGPAGETHSAAYAITPDGRTVAGSYGRFTGDSIPCVWTDGRAIDVAAYLIAQGIDLAGWELDSIIGISDDGRTLLGIGDIQTGEGRFSRAWMATIPAPGAMTVFPAMFAASLRRRR